jgi:hypothetical protein
MSQYIPQQAITHAPPISARVAKLLTVLLIMAVLVVTALLVWGGSNDPAPVKSPATQSVGGPNETLRGAAAAEATGAKHVTGGPNETLRGQAIQP